MTSSGLEFDAGPDAGFTFLVIGLIILDMVVKPFLYADR